MAPWAVAAVALLAAALLALRLRDRERRLARALQLAAVTDPLTGLLAFAGLEVRLEEELERARRHGRAVALLVADVDYLRAVNRLLGSRAGDIVLEQVGAILRDAARRADVVARVNGGRFAVVMPDSDERGALALAERLRGETRAAFQGGVAEITLSIGVAVFPKEADTGEALMLAGGCALRLAKQLGRDRAVVYTDQTAALLGELAAG